MDSLVDAMDLMDAGDKDEEGNRQPWFDTRLSYNPSLHRVKQALLHCAVVADITKNPLPPPHPELLKYFDPPRRVIKRARSVVDECKDIFKVKEVPKKVAAKTRKDGHAFAEDDDGELLLLDGSPELAKGQLQAVTTPSTSPSKAKDKAKAIKSEDSETEDDEEFVHVEKPSLASDKKSAAGQHAQKAMPFPTPARSASPMDVDDEIDSGRAPGRIIGTTNPLKDFRKNLEHGDVVSKAVEDMGYVISEIVMKPFAWRRTDELLECLREMRNVALQEDEIDTWNAFMKDFKNRCLAKGGNQEFWKQVKKAGQQLGLIGDIEAVRHAGISTVSERTALQFFA